MNQGITLLQAILIGLTSGLIGSVAGAIIGAWATLKASRQSLDGVYEHEIQKREYEEKKKQKAITQTIYEELKENLIIASDVLDNGNYKVNMSREAWNIHKGNIAFLPAELQASLPQIYHLVANYNGFINYDLMKLGHGAGYVDDKIRSSTEEFKGNVKKVIIQFENVLKKL